MPSFGAKLKQEREQRGITLEEISQSTKIGNRFLHALEQDRFDQLPGGIFNKGFVRAYARCVGMDEEEVIADYLAASGTAPEQPEAPAPLPEPRREMESSETRGLPWGALAIVLLIAALVLAIWGMHNRKVESGEAEQTIQVNKNAEAATPAAPVNTSTPTANPAAAEPPKPAPATEAAPAASKPGGNSEPASSPPITLQIKAREDSWILITIDGEVATRDTLLAGSHKSVHAAREIVVKAGNIGALDFELNGKSLPDQGEIGEVKTLKFDSSGARAGPTPPAAPSVH